MSVPDVNLSTNQRGSFKHNFSSSSPNPTIHFLDDRATNMAARVTFPGDLARNSVADTRDPDDNGCTSWTSVDLETCDELIL